MTDAAFNGGFVLKRPVITGIDLLNADVRNMSLLLCGPHWRPEVAATFHEIPEVIVAIYKRYPFKAV